MLQVHQPGLWIAGVPHGAALVSNGQSGSVVSIRAGRCWSSVEMEFQGSHRQNLVDGRGWISKLTWVNTLTVDTEAETGESIRAKFDVRRSDKALARPDQDCR